MSIYDIVKAQLGTAVPFAAHTGVELVEVAPGKGVASLAQSDTSINHIGSQHAGALFTLGEAASGAAMAGTFADIMMIIRPVAAEANITYLKVAKGTITATARTVDTPETLTAALNHDNKVRFDVLVVLTDEAGTEVAKMTVAWHVRKT
jgi:acyl-coenzyme A thioesterase PaaI-like protein